MRACPWQRLGRALAVDRGRAQCARLAVGLAQPTSNRDNVGVAKVLRLDARQHKRGVAVVVAESTIISPAKCPEDAIFRHDQ